MAGETDKITAVGKKCRRNWCEDLASATLWCRVVYACGSKVLGQVWADSVPAIGVVADVWRRRGGSPVTGLTGPPWLSSKGRM